VIATGTDGTHRRDGGSTICDEGSVPSAGYVEAQGQMLSVLSDDLSRRAAGELLPGRSARGRGFEYAPRGLGNGCGPSPCVTRIRRCVSS
jgi:hypothetical protein